MAFSYTTAGMTDNGSDNTSCVRGNVRMVSGTWTAGAAANGTIVTGLSKVLAFGVTCDEAAEAIQAVKNSNDGTAGTADGSIYIVPTDTTNNTGDWWAIGSNT